MTLAFAYAVNENVLKAERDTTYLRLRRKREAGQHSWLKTDNKQTNPRVNFKLEKGQRTSTSLGYSFFFNTKRKDQ